MYNTLKELLDDVVKVGYCTETSNGEKYYLIFNRAKKLFNIDKNKKYYKDETEPYNIILNGLKQCIFENKSEVLKEYVDVFLITETDIHDNDNNPLYSPIFYNMYAAYIGSRELIRDHVYDFVIKEIQRLIKIHIKKLEYTYENIIYMTEAGDTEK